MNLENYKWVQSAITPFKHQAKNHKAPNPNRLLVKARLKKDGQIKTCVTQMLIDYRGNIDQLIFDMTDLEVANFYAKNGATWKDIIDILKNDFGCNTFLFHP